MSKAPEPRRLRCRNPLAILALPLALPLATGATTPQEPSRGAEKLPEELVIPLQVGMGHAGSLLLQSYEFAIGGQVVERRLCERATLSEVWDCKTAAESTAYFITGVCSREGGDELYVAGLADDGTSLIERWSASPRQGGWRATTSPPAQSGDPAGTPPGPLGTPQEPAVITLTVTGGGAWQPAPLSVQSLPPAERTTLVTLPTGPIHGIDVDPQGRYLVFYDWEQELLQQLDLTTPEASPTTLAAASTTPSLDQVGSLVLMDFEGEGRKLLVRREVGEAIDSTQELYTMFSDPENDGVFAAPVTRTQAQWEASPYFNWSQWEQFLGD